MDLRRLDDRCCLALLFTGGGICGWIYETIFYYINDGALVKRGHGFGPWLPIYAIGSVLICLAGMHFQKSRVKVFLVSALISGAVEFVTGWFCYHFLDGLRLWDYNTEIWNWGNIGGYICLRSILLFAIAGVFLVYAGYPAALYLEDHLPRPVFYLISLVPAGLFILDIITGYFLKPL